MIYHQHHQYLLRLLLSVFISDEDEVALREERLPHAASPTAATATRPRPSHCFLFITEPPK